MTAKITFYKNQVWRIGDTIHYLTVRDVDGDRIFMEDYTGITEWDYDTLMNQDDLVFVGTI